MTLRRLKGQAVSVCGMTTYGGLEVQLHSFLTAALDDRSAVAPTHYAVRRAVWHLSATAITATSACGKTPSEK
jgi:hypothetical protein